MIVNIITLVTLSLTAMAIVREKEIGTMEQLMVTPIRPIELILGKTLPFVLVGYLGHAAGDGRGAADFSRALSRKFLLLLFADAAVPADHAGRGTVHLHDLAHAAAGHDGHQRCSSSRSSC